LRDAVIAGLNRPYIGVLAWPNPAGIRELLGPDGAAMMPLDMLQAPRVKDALRIALKRHNVNNPGSSTRIERLMLMAEPPSIEANEITDKGYVNQSATLARRAALVERLYSSVPDESVIVIE
jgi:feruloyl-CoA synthase